MSDYVIPRPASGDIVRLILEDHRLFEDLLREMRTVGPHRDAACASLPQLRRIVGQAEDEGLVDSDDTGQ